jgi:general secretion pathway protein C
VVRFMVATENGRMIGYKVRPGRKRELFDQVGLRQDDIVVSVNGIEVNEPQKVREVYQALKNATEANLQVMRDGSTHSIQITMSSEG